MKQAVILYGAPGAGKGTQAELLERNHDFIHFDPGRHIENIVHSPEARKSAMLRKERANFDAGRLCTPSWVLSIASKALSDVGNAGYNVVTSGSPRTLYEAFGPEGKNDGLIKTLIDQYGKNNLKIVVLEVKAEDSIHRNSSRRLCSVCGLPVLAGAKVESCAFCAGPLRTRTLDKPEIIKTRLEEYKERTFPILEGLKKQKLKIFKIDGTRPPYEVGAKIEKILGLK